MVEIPSVGPKKVRVLWKELGITSVDALGRACREGKLSKLKGFGAKTEQKILRGIEFRQAHLGMYLLSDALPVARRLLAHLEASKEVVRASLAGSLRRWKETVQDVDILVSSAAPVAVMNHFVKAEGVAEILAKGETKSSVRLQSGLQVDLRVVTDEQFPYALAYFTGSKEHNVAIRQLARKKGLKVSEYGIFRGSELLDCKDEEQFYAALDLPYVPPELRENTGELDGDALPRLISFGSLQGVFHTHSVWSDGTARIEEMAEKARSLGLRYMGLSDHSKAAGYANGLNETRLRNQMREVDALNKKWTDFRILKGLECDILPDGSLDMEPEILGELDFLIGSIHSRFDMPRAEMTDRICKALNNNNLDMLGHPTGRLLLSREPYAVDLDRVIEEARKYSKIIELNANPSRLDLDVNHCRRAKERGVMVSVNPDAHSTKGLEDIEYGLATARRAGLEEGDVLNTRDLDGVLEYLKD